MPGLSNVVSIQATGGSVLALTATGEVWAWGGNYYGQLGLGHNINVVTPAQIPGLTGVTSLASSRARFYDPTCYPQMCTTGTPNGYLAAGAYAIAAKADGSVWTWGDNSVGQLGNGTRVSSSSPVQVLGAFGQGYLAIERTVLDVKANGVSVLNNGSWTGFTFPNTNVGNTSAAQTMTYVNNGMTAWTGFSFPPTLGDFAQNNNCGSSLLPGASCTLNITFTPTRAGSRTVSMSMGGWSSGNSQLDVAGGLTLTGTGLGPQAVMSPSLGFGTQKTATTTTKMVTLTNAGNAALTVGTPGVTGTGFALGAATCGATLAAGASCTLNVNFAPTLVQAYTGNLTFASSNNPGGDVAMALSGTGAAAAAVRGDFNADGKADILWRDYTGGATSGQDAVWFMNGATQSSYAFASTAATSWSAVGVSDFNGDAKADILWRNQTTGANALWLMNAQNILTASLISSAAPAWSVAGTGDFDGDGKQDDILWFNATTRQTAVWITNAGQIVSAAWVGGMVSQGWSIAGVGDFDGNGKSDILWRNTNGSNAIWFMNGTRLASTAFTATASGIWSIKGVADFDGDGKADIFWQDTAGNTYVWLMNGAATKGLAPSIFVGTAWTALQFADFNGDGKADILWRNAAGATYVWLMNGLTLPTTTPSTSVPLNWTAIGK